MPDDDLHVSTNEDETLTGGDSADTFVFGQGHGNDVISGFTNGEDLIDLTQFPAISGFSDLTVTSDENGVTIDLTAHGGGTILLQGFHIDDLDASDFVFPIAGTTGDDTIYGGGGDDVIYGGAGDDWFFGGADDDTIYGGAGNDTIIGDAGDDMIYGGEDDDFIVARTGEDTIYGGAGDDRIYGGVGDDTIYGGGDEDTLRGDEGDDTLTGGAGDDSMSGGEGADTFVFGLDHGNDTITDFDTGNDTIDLSAFGDAITWEELSAQISDVTDEQGAVTGVQVDLSDWGGGTITLDGVASTDLTAGIFNLQGGDAVDETSEPEVDYVFHVGTDDDDTLTGGADNDAIIGGAGDDTISGGAGDDTIYSGAGDDTITGGTGNDAFMFVTGDGNDTITDFTDGEDIIDLSAITGITGFSDLSGKITQDGEDTVIDLSSFGGGEITLEDFTSTDLDATDFDFTM